jgi:integrase/recombinase XerD
MNATPINNKPVSFRIRFRRRSHTIYVRVTVNRIRYKADLSTGIRIEGVAWEAKRQRIKGSSPNVQALNHRLAEIEARLNSAYLQLLHQGKTITADRIIELYKGKSAPTLLLCVDRFNEQQAQMVGKGITKSTLVTYLCKRTNIANFIKSLHKEDLQLDEINKGLANQFEVYLKSQGFGLRHINKILQYFKRVVGWAHDNEYLEKHPLQYFKVKKWPEKDIEYIEPLEMRLIKSLSLNESLTKVRDLLLFSCETGFCYCDMMAVTRANVASMEGGLWLVGQRHKTTTKYAIPLTPEALDILEKYEGQLPNISNAKYNVYLKIIGERAGLTKRLHTHIGRKTKASMMINAGVPEITICRVLGLKSIGILRSIYAKLELKTVAKDMLAASQRMQPDTTVRPAIMQGFRMVKPLATIQLE